MNACLRTTLFFILLLQRLSISAQIEGEWAWMSGANSANATAVYGTEGVATSTNIPGNRDSQSGWVDPAGNFWLFGGDDNNANTMNDLWEYKPSTGQWTWVSGNSSPNTAGVYGTKGTAAATNMPGARWGQHMAVDPAGNFWLFGGATTANFNTTTELNDLWEYVVSTGQWTWVSGSNTTGSAGSYGTLGVSATTNQPGARIYPSTWADGSGNIWLFGGYGFDNAGTFGNLNDLWEYKPSTGQWTWVSGSNAANVSGVYGTEGTAAAGNQPGARNSASGWKDASGNFWIYGGTSGDFFSGGATFGDLWMFAPATGEWTWVNGDNTTGVSAVYGTEGIGAAANKPGARYAEVVVPDGAGNFWLFGGFDGSTGSAYNDLWVYSQASGQWAWVSGANSFNGAAVYGTEGVPAAANVPSARGYQSMWVDASDNVWVSLGYDGNNDNNDLFKFMIVTPLALDGLTLQGMRNGPVNDLSWTTNGAMSVVSLTLERSTDGQTYSVIATQAAVMGQQQYSYIDRQPPAGTCFYRVEAIQANGAFDFSPVVALAGTGGSANLVYPNPTRNTATLQTSDNNLLNTPARLFDMNGRIVGAWVVTGGAQVLDLGYLSGGVYLLQLADRQTLKIVKE